MSDRDIVRLFRKGSNRPCKALWRLDATNYETSAARATRAPGACLMADCGRKATKAGLCRVHDKRFRLKCRCGRTLSDIGVERGHCSRCGPRRRP